MIINHLTAATNILDAINRDLANNPHFTMTRDQLRARIYNYTIDNPNSTDADRISIFNMIAPTIRCFRD